MRILHVNKFFDFHGGAETYLHRIMEGQRAAGHDVHVFSTRTEKNIPTPDSKFFVKRWNMDRSDGARRDISKAMDFLWNRVAERAMGEMIRVVKPEVIHLHNIYHHLSTSILAPIRMHHIPCVQTLHDYKLACPNYKMFTEGKPCERCRGGKYREMISHNCFGNFSANLLGVLEKNMTHARQSYEKTVSLFLCPSHFLLERMENWGEPKKQLRYMPNPTELADTPAQRGGGYLLFAGRLSPEKGLDGFLKAALRIPEMPVKIVGRGPEEVALQRLVREHHGTNIEFLGFRTPKELTEIRRRAEAVVLPSIWYENASLSLLEALGDGLPCLTTRIGGNPELVEDEVNGLLVKPGDEADWMRIIRRFQALSSDARDKMAQAGREKIQRGRTWEAHLQELERIYKEVQKEKGLRHVARERRD
jgi:glycosyltransferase involved in cell wall biosynthesis